MMSRYRDLSRFALGLLPCLAACGSTGASLPAPAPRSFPSAPSPSLAQPAPTLAGMVTYEDGGPAVGAQVAVAERETGSIVDVLTVDRKGHYQGDIPAGEYALAVATSDGFAWVERQQVPSTNTRISISRKCFPLKVYIESGTLASRGEFERQSSLTGDTFVGLPNADGAMSVCLPEGQYETSLAGDVISAHVKIDLPGTRDLRLKALSSTEVKQAPKVVDHIRADLRGVVDDINASDSKLIGLGEATHGTAEFYSARSELTFDLVRRTGVRLILFELDAIAAVALDRYVNGAPIDLPKAVAGLGFWTSDTYEFLRFIGELRKYNATLRDKIHIWGIDIQNTTLPVGVLVDGARTLGISTSQQATLQRLVKRGAGVKELSAEERADVDALLARLSTPPARSQRDLLIAVAARSLALQLDYWSGETAVWSRKRRDIGMAKLANYIIEHTGARRACLWAHDAHISREPGASMLGYHLSSGGLRYYSVGFYLHQGTARAWDTATKIGVISHTIPSAPPFVLEDVVMQASGMPEIAWLPLKLAPPSIAKWLELPRYVRELYAVYDGEGGMMILRDIRAAFDAVVVIRTGHDSSPTPTGVRTATQ